MRDAFGTEIELDDIIGTFTYGQQQDIIKGQIVKMSERRVKIWILKSHRYPWKKNEYRWVDAGRAVKLFDQELKVD